MAQEDKQLLLTDLCGRLPYGVMCKIDNRCVKVEEINPFEGVITYDGWLSCGIDEDIKPYLRPLSSMTEDEYNDMFHQLYSAQEEFFRNYSNTDTIGKFFANDMVRYDWLNKKMFDYRWLIPKGLAETAPEGMYNN